MEKEYSVELLSCGERALECFRKSKPYLVLLDIGRHKVCQKLREINKEIPIVFMSAQREERKIAEQLGVNSYLIKPINFDKLLCCVNQNLKG